MVQDGKLITSRGPGTAFHFAIQIVRAVRGDDGVADKLAEPMLLEWVVVKRTTNIKHVIGHDLMLANPTGLFACLLNFVRMH